jgi:peptidoglycan LD-endopeptidase LytH
VKKRRRLDGHRVSGSVIAALIVGCCVGVLADWRLREKGPPGPAETARPALITSAPKEPLPIPTAVAIRAESTEEELAHHGLRFPIDRMDVEPLKGGFDERRGGGTRPHEAVDILAPRNTPVYAVENGTIAKLFFSKAGGNTVYQFDPSGRFCYYYAHLERYAEGIRDGQRISRSDVLGYVGTSGNAPPNTPHLHFAIFELTPARHWWQGMAIDPYLVFRHVPR